MLGNLFKKSEKNAILSIDFGSEAVKAVLFKKENEKTRILGYSIQSFENFGIFDISGFEPETTKKIVSKAIEDIKKQSDEGFKGVYLRLPADILKGEISLEIYKRKNGKKNITKGEEKDIYQKVLKQAENNISKIYSQEVGILPEDLRFITLKIFEIKIEGYEVSELCGFDGERVEFKILATFLPKHYLETIKKVLSQLNLEILKVAHTAELLMGINDYVERGGIFLDIGGDTTQIIFFKNKKLEIIDEINIGGRIISRLISQVFGIPEREARILKEKYSDKKLTEESRSKTKEIISTAIQNWFGNLKLKLFQFKIFLPTKIFLFGGGSQLLGIEEILAEGDWDTNLFSGYTDVSKSYPSDVYHPQVKFIVPVIMIVIFSIARSRMYEKIVRRIAQSFIKFIQSRLKCFG